MEDLTLETNSQGTFIILKGVELCWVSKASEDPEAVWAAVNIADPEKLKEFLDREA